MASSNDPTLEDGTLDEGLSSQPHSVTLVLDDVSAHGPAERYSRVRPLGEGGMGEVHLTVDRQIGRQIALKTLRGRHAPSARAQQRFLREARVQGQLEHPSVVPVYDLGVDADGELFFTMKRVRGETLEHIVAGLRDGVPGVEARYPRHRLLTAFASLCMALDFAHERGVLHRDVKPANVMLGDYGEVYLLDWGLARIAGSEAIEEDVTAELVDEQQSRTRTGALLGTPGYMSPEQARGRHAELTRASDVYALGCVLYELLTHEPLNPGANAMEAVANSIAGLDARASARAPQALVPPELERICVRAVAARPQDRYPSARALHDELDAFLAGQRDASMRAELADAHAKRAAGAVVGRDSQPDTLEVRRGAMRDIGRALALDPENPHAQEALERLLREPPSTLPPEVRLEIRRAKSDRVRWTAGVGAIVYASLILYLPLFLATGMRDPLTLGVFYGLAAACATMSAIAWRQRHPSDALVVAVMLASNAMIASLWSFFGPLVIVPTLMVANTVAFAVQLEGRMRALTVIVGAGCVAGAFVLEALGLVGPTFHFEAEQLVLHAPGLRSWGATLAFVGVVSVAAVVTTAAALSRVRDALADVERRLYIYAWHLREVVPASVRPTTDPTVGRRKRPPREA